MFGRTPWTLTSVANMNWPANTGPSPFNYPTMVTINSQAIQANPTLAVFPTLPNVPVPPSVLNGAPGTSSAQARTVFQRASQHITPGHPLQQAGQHGVLTQATSSSGSHKKKSSKPKKVVTKTSGTAYQDYCSSVDVKLVRSMRDFMIICQRSSRALDRIAGELRGVGAVSILQVLLRQEGPHAAAHPHRSHGLQTLRLLTLPLLHQSEGSD